MPRSRREGGLVANRYRLLALAALIGAALLPNPAQALPRQSCASLATWVASDKGLRSGTWGTEPIYRAAISGTTLHNAEYIAWLDDPCFVSHEDLTVAELPVKGRGLPDPSYGRASAATILDRIYGPNISSDFESAATTRLPNEIVLLGTKYA